MCRTKPLKIAIGALMALSLAYNHSVSFRMANTTYARQIDCVKNVLLELATWLKQNTPEDSLIALHDIGVVGYFSHRPLLELVGLINPEISAYYWDSRSKRPVIMGERKVIRYVIEKRPDYLVMLAEWDKYLNVLQPVNQKYFQLLHTTLPLYPTEMRYKVFKCTWENND
jgi:hypothetical protein